MERPPPPPESKQRRQRARAAGVAAGALFVSAWIVWHFALLRSFEIVVLRDGSEASRQATFAIAGTAGAHHVALPVEIGSIRHVEIVTFVGGAKRHVDLLVGTADEFDRFHPNVRIPLSGGAIARHCRMVLELEAGQATAGPCLSKSTIRWRKSH